MTQAPPRLPQGFRLLAYERLASSNDEAKRLAREGAAEGTTVWSREQTAGRGRRGRAWISIPGNLHVSFILRPNCPAQAAAQLGFVAALALGETMLTMTPREAELRYKWPNDVLLNARKVSGILLESEMNAAGAIDWLVIGIGVNVVGHPAETPYPSSSLREEGCIDADATMTLEGLAPCLAAWLGRWRGEGFAPIRAAWLARAFGLGLVQTARLEHEEVTGRFADLDADGALLLETAGGCRRVAAGEIFPARISGCGGP